MRNYLACIPCFIRQALDAARMKSDDCTLHERVVRDILSWMSGMDLGDPPPALGRNIHRKIREFTGISDPYLEVKEVQNRPALDLLPELRAMVKSSPNPLGTAVALSIAGNIMDTAVEIVIYRLLIEQLRHDDVTAAVRGAPILNDATRRDALTAGLPDIARVIHNGSDAPGTILSDCSAEFQETFHAEDLIIAKGQGNFETLCDEPAPPVFLFTVKCPVIAETVRDAQSGHTSFPCRIQRGHHDYSVRLR